MWFEAPIYNNGDELIIRLGSTTTRRWYDEITAICGRDHAGRLVGCEIYLYEEPKISLNRVRRQFQGFDNIEVDLGIFYIRLRKGDIGSWGTGFGRGARVGVDEDGNLTQVIIPWVELDAAVPFVEAEKALEGLPSQDASQRENELE